MRRFASGTVLAAFVILSSANLLACPFCTAVSQTFTEEIASMDVVVIARLIEAPPVPDATTGDPDAPLPRATFRIEQVLKGDKWVSENDLIRVLYFGEPDKTKRYLVMGTDPPQPMWSTPLALSERARGYVLNLPKLPESSDRLKFFQEHLEDADEMLARDAYDEFANAPYEDVLAIKDHIHHDRLIKWIKDPDIPASRRRLYFTMLGVCGQPEDAPLLEAMMKSDDRKQKSGLDALIACYLILKGGNGLAEVDKLFLKNDKSDYADTYAAIMAIRFHGNQIDVIDKKRLVKSLRHMLDRPELADLVIPDLARWNDWDVMPRLVQLFKEADEKSSWVRVPVINYLRSCPLPDAQEQIEELSKIDPEAVKRAQTFFPFESKDDGQTQQATPDEKETSSLAPTPAADVDVVTAASPVGDTRDAVALVTHVEASADGTNEPPQPTAAREPVDEITTSADPENSAWQPNLMHLWGVPMLAGLVLFAIFRVVLGRPIPSS